MVIAYKNWNQENKTWDTDLARYYLLLDSTVHGTDHSYFSHSAGFYANTPEDVKAQLTQWLARFPAFTLELFRASNARIVKAPCAFDAREQNVFVEAI